MPKLNAKFTHTRILMSNGKIKPVTIITRTSQDDVMVRRFTKDTPFRAVTITRTRNGSSIKFLQEDSTPVNLVDNGSATTTTLTGWDWVTRNTSQFNTAPASWEVDYDVVNDWYQASFYKPNLVVGQRYSVSFWAKAVNPGTNVAFTFSTGVGSGFLNITPSTSVWTYYKIENQLCTTNANLTVSWNSLGDRFYIDDVAVVLGPTAV